MQYRTLGRSGIEISALTLGSMTFGGDTKVGGLNLSEAARLVDCSMDAGVNFIDTADIYSDGQSEEMIGTLLADGHRRRRLLVATKLGLRSNHGPNGIGASRHRIMGQVENQLRRLRCETIDLLQLHAWDGFTPIHETLDALDRLVAVGKVRYIGCSNYSGWQLSKAIYVAENIGLQGFVSQQLHYTLYSREAEYELVPIAVDNGVGVIVWSPLAGGLLSGKYRKTSRPADGRHVEGFPEPPIHDWERLYAIVDELVTIAEEVSASPAQVALAWTLSRAAVCSVIIGARTEAQLTENLGVASLSLGHDHLKRLEDVSAVPLPYPHWHQANSVSERFSPADLASFGQS